MAFELPALAYATDALEPHIDKMTMEIHHGKHHQAYVDNVNKALAGTEGENHKIEDLMKSISKYPMAVRSLQSYTLLVSNVTKRWWCSFRGSG